jgi:hypothetical protein
MEKQKLETNKQTPLEKNRNKPHNRLVLSFASLLCAREIDLCRSVEQKARPNKQPYVTAEGTASKTRAEIRRIEILDSVMNESIYSSSCSSSSAACAGNLLLQAVLLPREQRDVGLEDALLAPCGIAAPSAARIRRGDA